MSCIITFNIIGTSFSPRKIRFEFNQSNEPDEISNSGRSKGQKYGYGSASYIVPKETSRLEIFKHLADTFEPLLDELTNCGAESWHIGIGRLYFNQCNEELGIDEIIQIARLKCAFTYSAYRVSAAEEKEGFDHSKYFQQISSLSIPS